MDDACLISPDKSKIQHEIKSLQKDFALTDDGPFQDYIGTRFERHADGSVTLSQPRMIERLLTIVGLDSKDTHIKLHDTQQFPSYMTTLTLLPASRNGTTVQRLVVFHTSNPSFDRTSLLPSNNAPNFVTSLDENMKKPSREYAATC